MILVFEDDPRLRDLYQRALAGLDRLVELFEAPEHGWHLLSEAALVITDLEMPGMGGLRLLQHLEHDPLSPPVVVVSGSSRLEEARELAWAALEKPIQLEELIGVCRRILEPDRARKLWTYEPGSRNLEPSQQVARLP